jgi:hypothetical protein
MMLANEDDEWEFDDDDDFSWDDDDEEDEEVDEDEDLSDIPDYDAEEEDEEEETAPKQTAAPEKPQATKVNYAEVKIEKRPARLDITKNSEEDSRYPNRHTKGDLEDQVKKDFRYMKGKGFFMIQPFLIMDEYPFKTKNSDSDIPRSDGKNVAEDLVLVIGRLPKFKSIEEFKGKPYIRGEIMLVRPGLYDIGQLKPHFALVIKKKYKVIKQAKIRIRELFDIVKNELQNGKPFVLYKEFPKKIV